MSLQVYAIKSPMLLVKEGDVEEIIRKDSVFTNIPYDICHLSIPPGRSVYSVAVMAYKKEECNRIPFRFSLQVRYPKLVEGIVKPIQEYPNYHFLTRACGQWTSNNNGGRPSGKTFLQNPQYSFHVLAPTHLHAYLESINDRNSSLSLHLLNYKDVMEGHYSKQYILAESDAYTKGACMLEQTIQPGQYTLVVSEFDRVDHGKYMISTRSSYPLQFVSTNAMELPVPGMERFMQNSIIKVLGKDRNCGLSLRGFQSMDL